MNNVVDIFQLYDLHTGRSGEHRNSMDGCRTEDVSCGLADPHKLNYCGINGTCVGSFSGNFQCICEPGWRGPKCSIRKSNLIS